MNAECKQCDKLGGYYCNEECDHWEDEPRSLDTLPASCSAADIRIAKMFVEKHGTPRTPATLQRAFRWGYIKASDVMRFLWPDWEKQNAALTGGEAVPSNGVVGTLNRKGGA